MGGTFSPSVFAVFRLSAKSNFVGGPAESDRQVHHPTLARPQHFGKQTFLDATGRARSCRLCCKTPFAQLIAKLGTLTELPLGRRFVPVCDETRGDGPDAAGATSCW